MPVHVGDNDVRAVFAKVDDVESLSRWHKRTAGETTTDKKVVVRTSGRTTARGNFA